MDRQIVYAGQIPLETDLLNTNRNAYTALGMLIQDMFGTSTVFSGLGCVPTSPAGMTVNVNPGRVYSLQQRDPAAYSSLGQDTTNQIMKQGVLLSATNFSCPAPATSGYSVNYLISASFLEQDTNAVVLPYYNSTNPSQAFSGPPVNGQSSGTAQNTTRQDTIQLTLTAGVAATTGSQQTPATPTGQIPLWVITVSYGQSSITASSISAVSGSPFAPTGGYFQAVGERYSSIINATSTQTLTTAALGALVNITATGTTQTLPPASACPNGTSITLVYMQSSGSATVTRNGTDALSFGQGSSANSITLSPGEEVQFVSNGANGWVSAGQTLSTGVTPPQFDNSTKLATTAFVRSFGMQASAFTTLVGTTTLTAANAGSTVYLGGSGNYTVTLPLASAVPAGARIEFISGIGSSPVTISRQGADVIYMNASTSLNTVPMALGDTYVLESNGASWYSVGGSTPLAYTNGFSSSLGTSGYQKLPSGLIFQWTNGASDANGNMVVTNPIAFQTAPLGGLAGEGAPGGWMTGTAAVWAFDISSSSKTTSFARVRNVSSSGPGVSSGIAGRVLVWGY